MNIQNSIEKMLTDTYKPVQLDIVNESDLHSGPKGRESHFKVLLVSDFFIDMKRVDRQKHIFQTLNLIMTKIHALSLRVLTLAEAEKSSDFQSPDCSHKKI
jgi:BolA protein